MKIQWYPGHMTKAVRMMEEMVSVCDGVIFVLDARCPISSYNEKLESIFSSKPVIYVLCKGDMADEKADDIARAIGKTHPCIKINAFSQADKKALISLINDGLKEKRQKAKMRGYDKIFRFMVAGVPNTGKSTLINLLAGKKRAVTGDKAGVTRGRQWISCGEYALLDTPGTCPPSFENETKATRLAFVGSINDDILPMDELSLELLQTLKDKYPERLQKRYNIINMQASPQDMLDEICAHRGFILKGNEPDYERAYRAILDDFRSGKLGRITLDDVEELDF